MHTIIKALMTLASFTILSACSAQDTPALDAADQDPVKTEMALKLIEQMRSGQFDQAVKPFNTKMAEALPADKLKSVWNTINSQAGPFQKVLDVTQRQSGENITVFAATQFEKAILDTKIAIDNDNQIIGLFFSPSKYKPSEGTNTTEAPLNVSSSDTAIVFGDTDWRLPGKITYPKSGNMFPLVILVHGSGPNDMDLTVGPNKPFLDIANGLARNGIATLRYNKRTNEHQMQYAQNPEFVKNLTVNEETVDDAVHAFNFAKKLDMIDPEKIFIAGISQGGMLMPRIAKQTNAAGYIMLAAPARGLEVLLMEQYQYIMGLDDEYSAEETQAIEVLKKQIGNLEKLTLESDIQPTDLPLGLPKKYWLDLKSYDIVTGAQSIEAPLLIIQGGRDYQVLASKDFKVWTDTFTDKKNVTLKMFPTLNHLMIHGEGPSTPEEYSRPGNVDTLFIEYINDWIKEH